MQNLVQSSLERWRSYVVLILAYVLVAGFTFWMFGVKVVADSERYLEYADGLRSGLYVDPFNIWYIGYVIFLFLIRLISFDPWVVVVAQYLLSLVAVLFLYKASCVLFNNKTFAIVTALLYIAFAEIIAWNSYLVPEGIYASFIVFALYFIVKPKQTARDWILAVMFTLFAIVIKPTGIAIVGALIAVVVTRRAYFRGQQGVHIAFGIVATMLFLFVVNYMLNSYILIGNYLKGEIVYGITTLPTHPDYQLLTIDVPPDAAIPVNSDVPLIQIIGFIIVNPVFFSKLFFSKILVLLIHIKPYWSVTHAIIVGVLLFPAYFFFIRALKKAVLAEWLRVFAVVYCVLHIVIIGMTSEDWDGRFLMPILPLVFLIAPAGLPFSSTTKLH